MTTWFITRHTGAVEWAEQQGIKVDRAIAHLEMEMLEPGDKVIGVLPVNLACEVCTLGGEYYHISMELPLEARGVELTAQDMRNYQAKLQRFYVEQR